MSEIVKNRSSYFDNVKSVLIFFVVIGHFAEVALGHSQVFKSIFLWLYFFHMPLFIFITGYFSKNLIKNKERVFKRSFEFFSLFIIMKITFFIIRYFFDGNRLSFSIFSETSVPWYLLAISIMYLLSYALKDLNPKAVLLFFTIISLFAGYDSEIRDFLVLSRTLMFFPFFLLGLMCNESFFTKLKSHKINYVLASSVIIISILIFYLFPDELYIFRPLLTARNPYKFLSDELIPFGIFMRAAVYLVALILSIAFLIVIPKFNLRYFTKIGAKTLPIYFFHRQVIWIFQGLELDLFLQNKFGSFVANLIWLLLAIILTVVLSLNIFELPLKLWGKFLFSKKASDKQ